MRHVVRTASPLYVRRMCSAEWTGSSGVVFETRSFIRPHLFADVGGTSITTLRGPDAVRSILPEPGIARSLAFGEPTRGVDIEARDFLTTGDVFPTEVLTVRRDHRADSTCLM